MITQEERQAVKDKLKRYRDIKLERERILQRIKEMEAERCAPSSPRLDGMPRSSSRGDAMTNYLHRKGKLESLYIEKGKELEAEQLAIEGMIDSLDPLERTLMRCKYIDDMTWEDVCKAINYGWTSTHKIHARALDKLAEKSRGH